MDHIVELDKNIKDSLGIIMDGVCRALKVTFIFKGFFFNSLH